MSDKRVFNTFARTLPPSSKVSKSVVALLKAFKWHRFVVVSGSHPASGSEVQEAIEVSHLRLQNKEKCLEGGEINVRLINNYCSRYANYDVRLFE